MVVTVKGNTKGRVTQEYTVAAVEDTPCNAKWEKREGELANVKNGSVTPLYHED